MIFHRVNRIWHVEAARKCEAGRPIRGWLRGTDWHEAACPREQVIE